MEISISYQFTIAGPEAVTSGRLNSQCANPVRRERESSFTARQQQPVYTLIEKAKRPVLLAGGIKYPTSLAFDQVGRVWFSEPIRGNLCCLNEGEIVRFPVDGAPEGITFDPFGRIFFCDSKNCSIRRYDPISRKTETLVKHIDRKCLSRPKDLAFDTVGNLVFTCPGDSKDTPTGYVCVLTKKGDVRRIASGFYFPSGLAFSPDGRYLVVAETYRQRLWRGYWDMKRARWSELLPWANVGGTISPAGIAYGADGTFYVSIRDDGMIKTVASDGEVRTAAQLPNNLPTKIPLRLWKGPLDAFITGASAAFATNFKSA